MKHPSQEETYEWPKCSACGWLYERTKGCACAAARPATPKSRMTLDDLEALAKAATPGPWTAFTTGCIWSDDGDAVVSAGDDGKPYGMHSAVLEIEPRDAAYIAAASPDAILDLIRRVREAERAKASFRVAVTNELAFAGHEIERLRAERDTALARVREVEAERDALAQGASALPPPSDGAQAESPETKARLDRACRPWDETRTARRVSVQELLGDGAMGEALVNGDAPPSDGGARQMDEAIARREARIAELETRVEAAEAKIAEARKILVRREWGGRTSTGSSARRWRF